MPFEVTASMRSVAEPVRVVTAAASMATVVFASSELRGCCINGGIGDGDGIGIAGLMSAASVARSPSAMVAVTMPDVSSASRIGLSSGGVAAVDCDGFVA